MSDSQEDKLAKIRQHAAPAEEVLPRASEFSRSAIASTQKILQEYASENPFEESESEQYESPDVYDFDRAVSALTQVYMNILNRKGALKI